MADAKNIHEINSLKCSKGSLEVVDSCYLGNIISSGGGCSESIVARVRMRWKKFRELLSLLATKSFSFRVKVKLRRTVKEERA